MWLFKSVFLINTIILPTWKTRWNFPVLANGEKVSYTIYPSVFVDMKPMDTESRLYYNIL